MNNPYPVCQWTHGPGNYQHLYFTSASVTADDRWIAVIHEDAEGVSMRAIDRTNGDIVPVSEPVPIMYSYVYGQGERGRGFGKASPVLDETTGNLFWIEDDRVRMFRLGEDDAPRDLASLPSGWVTAFNHVSPDGKTLVVPLTEPDAFLPMMTDQGSQMLRVSARMVNRGLVTRMLLIDIPTGATQCVAEVPFWVTHVQFDPGGSGRILFNSEGSYFATGDPHIRIWVLETDGTFHPLYRQPSDHEVTHENFNPDGSLVVYHGHDRDGRNFVAARTLDGVLVWQTPTDDFRTMHAVATRDAPGFTADTNSGEICLGRYDDSGKIDWTTLCRHDSTFSYQDAHPHPRMNPDGKGVVFTSVKPGCGTVFEVRLD